MSEPSVIEWINASAALIGAFAVIIGLFGANAKINEGRRLQASLRKSQIAEELIAITLNVQDAIGHIRNPIDTIPFDKSGDRKHLFQRRFERLTGYGDLFKSLREAQIRALAVLGDNDVDQAVEELFRARNQVSFAIEMLFEYSGEAEIENEERELIREWKSTLYARPSKENDLGNTVDNAVGQIVSRLSPIARLESPL